jgi:hypothetical protein
MSYDAAVLTPFSWSGPAIELGNRVWRKKVLPVGDVQYQGRTLHFTPDYLQGLEQAFRDRAYDYVPLQLATGKNEHTNDPDRFRGTITDMRAEPDGLYITLNPTEDGERVLAENPYLGVSCRIVENYARSDGQFYKAAVQHVLATHDPRIPALGPWQATDLSNSGGQMIIDLTGSAWAGEPAGPPELTLTDAELQEWLEAIDEADAEMALNSGWRDTEAPLGDFSEQFQRNWDAEQARELARSDAHLEDITRPVIRAEDRMARAISRIESGIFDTSRVSTFANEDRSVELTVQTGYGPSTDEFGNSFVDAYGRDASRYPFLGSRTDVSTDWMALPDDVRRATLTAALANFAAEHDTSIDLAATYGGDPADPDDPGYPIPASTIELAHRLNQSWGLAAPDIDGLTGTGYAGNAYAALAAELGRPDLAGPQPDFQQYPDVSEYARQMGLK